MKIIILHGQNSDKSYARLLTFTTEAKSRGWEVLYDDLFVTPSLFDVKRLIVITDYKLLNKKKLETLNKIDGTLVIYHKTEIPKLSLKLFSDAKIESFDYPKNIWKFLGKPTTEAFHELLEVEAPEFIFGMLVWNYKKKYLVTPSDKIREYINELARIDILSKTSKADLIQALDLFIVKNLQ